MSIIESSPAETMYRDPTTFIDEHYLGILALPSTVSEVPQDDIEVIDGEIMDPFSHDEYTSAINDNERAIEQTEEAIDRAVKSLPVLMERYESDKKQLGEINTYMAQNHDEQVRIAAANRELVGGMISATSQKNQIEQELRIERQALTDAEDTMEPIQAIFDKCEQDVEEGNALGTSNMSDEQGRNFMQSWETLNTSNDFLHEHTRLTNEIESLRLRIEQLVNHDLNAINELMLSNSQAHKQNEARLNELSEAMQEHQLRCRVLRERVKVAERILSSLADDISDKMGSGMLKLGTELERVDDETVS